MIGVGARAGGGRDTLAHRLGRLRLSPTRASAARRRCSAAAAPPRRGSMSRTRIATASPASRLVSLGALIHALYVVEERREAAVRAPRQAGQAGARRRARRGSTNPARRSARRWRRRCKSSAPAASSAPRVAKTPRAAARRRRARGVAFGAGAVAGDARRRAAEGRLEAPGDADRARRICAAGARHAGGAEEGRPRKSPTTRWSRTRGCSKACSTISASRARSSTCAPARW